MPLTVSELQARVSAQTSEAERAFEQFNNVQKEVGTTAEKTAAQVEEAGEKIDNAGKKVQGSWQKFGKELGNVSSRLTTLGAGLSIAITAPIIGLGKDALDTAVRFDSLNRGMTAVMHSSSAARQEFGKLREVARMPGLGMEEALQGSINLQAAGLSAKDAREALMGFGNALAIVGKGKDDLAGVNLALSQIATKGKVMGQDIRQLQERVPQIRQIMLDAFGSADTEILQRAQVTSKDFIEIIVRELNKLPKMTGGVKNDIENLSDDWKLMLKEMGEALFPFVKMVSDNLVPAFRSIAQTLKEMSPERKNMLVWFTLMVAAIGPLITILGVLAGAINNLIELFTAFGLTSEAFGAVLTGITTGPIALIVAAIIGLYLAWKNNWGGIQEITSNIFSSIRNMTIRFTQFVSDLWKDFLVEIEKQFEAWGTNTHDVLKNFQIAWDSIWYAIGFTARLIMLGVQVTVDTVLGAIRIAVLANLQLLRGDFKGAWETIKDTVSKSWDDITKDTTSAFAGLQDQFNSYYDQIDKIVGDRQQKVNDAMQLKVNPALGRPNPGIGALRVEESSVGGSPLPIITPEMERIHDSVKGPDFNLPSVGNGNLDAIQQGYRKTIQGLLNQPKKHKMTDEERQELSFTKALNDAKAELNALRAGETKEMADTLGQYNLLNPARVAELGHIKEQIKAVKDESAARKKAAQDLADEQKRFHDAVKGTEAAIRDMRSGNKKDSIEEQFPHASKNMIAYFSALKDNLQHLKDVKQENDNFKQSLAEVNGQIESLISGDGLAALKAQFKNLVPATELQKLADANAQFKSLQQLQSAMDKLTLLQMPERERKAATALGIDMWKTMTDEAKNNTLAIFDNIKAQEDLAKSIEKANEAAQKRADTLKEFSESMQQRTLAANASLAGDTVQGAFDKMLAGNANLRDALGEGPTAEKAKAFQEFMEAFTAEQNAKKILDVAEALDKFNTSMDESIKLSQLRISGHGDSVEAEWQRFLLSNKSLANKFKEDVNSERQAFEKFKESFNLDRQAQRLEEFNSKMADMQKQYMEMSAIDPFEKFKASMQEIKDGKLIQPFTDEQLQQMFQMQRIIDYTEQLQNIFEDAIGNLRNGFGAFFDSIVQGFEKMLQDMAAKWLASQLVSLITKIIGVAIGAAAGGGSSAASTSASVGAGAGASIGDFTPTGNFDTEGAVTASSYMQKAPVTHVINFNISTPDVGGFKQSQGQIMTDAKRQADYYESKNVSKYNRSR